MDKGLPDTKPFAPFEWMLAMRYLRARRREGFISVISLFSFLGILLGVATLIVVMSVLNGFRAELLDKILGFQGHASVYSADLNPLQNYQDIAARLEKIPGVARVTPLVEGQAMASSLRNNTGALVRGISEADIEKLPSIVNDNLRTALKEEGVPDDPPSFKGFDASEGVAIGERMAWRHQLGLGSTLTIISPEGPETIVGNAPRIRDYPVVAIFKVGMSDYDENVIYMPLVEAQDYFVTEEGVNQIEVTVENPDDIEALIPAHLREASGEGMAVQTWKQRNLHLLQCAGSGAQRDVPGADDDHPGRGTEHHFRSHHAGEGQGPRHRHPAHHGSHARRRSSACSSSRVLPSDGRAPSVASSLDC